MRDGASTAQRGFASRAAILTAAVEQIAVSGYDGVRLRDIARAAGVSIGLLQHHFGARRDLLAEALEHHCAALLRDEAELAQGVSDPWLRITMLVHRLAHAPDVRLRAAVWTEFNAAASRREELRPPLRHIYAAWRTQLLDAIAAGSERGIFEPRLPAPMVADLLVGEIDGTLLAIVGDGRVDGATMGEQIVAAAEVLLGREAGR